jgi:uncharacterized protein YjbJ (UPF0337 family)
MSHWDEAKGRVKEAIGDLTKHGDMKPEGKMDRAAGKVKDALDKTAEKVKETFDKATERHK